MSLESSTLSTKRRKIFYGLVAVCSLSLVGVGVMAANGWLPKTDPLSGKKTGWFGKELPANSSSSWNPFAPPMPSGTPQLSKEYIYAGSRLLAVEDANSGAAPTPTPGGIEGDIVDTNGGPAGDGAVLANDVSVIRAALLGTITLVTTPNQFQRGDVNDPCGNGGIDAGDVTLIRQMVIGGVPNNTPACGPTEPSNRPEGSLLAESKNPTIPETNVAALPADLRIRVNNATGPRGQSVTIPVFMKMDRDETAVAFTLEYDTAKFSNPRVTLNSELPASTVLSTNVTRPGKIGILLDAEGPLSNTPRELRIVFVVLDIRPTATTGPSSLSVTNSLAKKAISSSNFKLLPAEYTDGTVSISP